MKAKYVPPHVYREKIAKAFGKANGYAGKVGGWIYVTQGQWEGRAVAQGWLDFFNVKRDKIRAWLFQEIGS